MTPRFARFVILSLATCGGFEIGMGATLVASPHGAYASIGALLAAGGATLSLVMAAKLFESFCVACIAMGIRRGQEGQS